jgi:NAD(P)-dependent dehydrogenase (short-subunit alcohol dehydrogenase family)
MDCRRFLQRVALVTGGAGSIGAATARRLAAEGARVAILDRDQESVDATVAALRQEGADAFGVVADVCSEEQVSSAVAAVANHFGRLEVVFNNAGVGGVRASVHELPVDTFDEILRINLRGVFLTQKYALLAMIRSGAKYGAVVNMSSSMAGFDVHSGGCAYAASKHAILGLTQTAAIDMAPYGIRVNAVCPGVIETSLGMPDQDRAEAIAYRTARIPLRRVGQPNDVAALVAFLASSDATHITGVGWLIDGGQTIQSWANAPRGPAYPWLAGNPA